MNKVMLIGNLGDDAKIFPTKDNNLDMLTFKVATNKYFKDKKQTTWHNVMTFRKKETASKLLELLKKGVKVFVEGEISYKTSESEGRVYNNCSIIALNLIVFNPKKQTAETADLEIEEHTQEEGNLNDYEDFF